MPDYTQGKIYKLISPSHPEINPYYGSTTSTLSKRKSDHKSAYKRYTNRGSGNYYTSFELLRFDDTEIELVLDYPCNTNKELHLKENEYIRDFDCINKQMAFQSDDERKQYDIQWHAKNYQTNKVEILERQKQYNDSHKVQSKRYNDSHKEHKKQYNKRQYDKKKQQIKSAKTPIIDSEQLLFNEIMGLE